MEKTKIAIDKLIEDMQELKKTKLYASSFKCIDDCLFLAEYYKKEELKQETLEAAAEEYKMSMLCDNGTAGLDFIEGANWQAERMYSDSIQFGTWLLLQDITSRGEGVYVDDKGDLLTVKDLFEQFKKKCYE